MILTKTLDSGIRNQELGSKLLKSVKDSYNALEHLELPSSYSANQELLKHIIWANSIDFPNWLDSRFYLNSIRQEGGFPVDYPELMPLDRSIHHRWKNAKNGGLYSLWNRRKRLRKTAGGFINDVNASWASIPQSVYQNAIEGTRKIIQKCHDNRGKIRM